MTKKYKFILCEGEDKYHGVYFSIWDISQEDARDMLGLTIIGVYATEKEAEAYLEEMTIIKTP